LEADEGGVGCGSFGGGFVVEADVVASEGGFVDLSLFEFCFCCVKKDAFLSMIADERQIWLVVVNIFR
jgi:hypothetical protein